MTLCANRFFSRTRLKIALCSAVLLVAGARQASAKVVLFLEEPYSYDGRFAGTGHAAVYLTNVCASSPVSLRQCEPGERGVVISRYYKIAGYDWLAIPLIPYLYAVQNLRDAPVFADEETADFLRDQYRRKHLENFAPDDPGGLAPGGHWVEVVGVAYRRTIYAFEIEAGSDKDEAFIREFNARQNKGKFNLITHNCADFARNVIDFYYPKAVHRSIFGDLGVTTPKQLGRTITHYGHKHPDTELTMFVIPQVPGTIPRSRHIHGVIESAFGAKKYLLPIALLNPVVAGSLAIGTYLDEGHVTLVHNAKIFDAARGLETPLSADERRFYQQKLDALGVELDETEDGTKLSLQNAKASLDDAGRPVLHEQIDGGPRAINLTRDSIAQSAAPDLETRLLMERISQELKRDSIPKVSSAQLKEDWELLQRVERQQRRAYHQETLTASGNLTRTHALRP